MVTTIIAAPRDKCLQQFLFSCSSEKHWSFQAAVRDGQSPEYVE